MSAEILVDRFRVFLLLIAESVVSWPSLNYGRRSIRETSSN